MLPLETAWVFFAASVALGVAPGPDNIFVLTQSVVHGPRAGLLVTLGLCTGLVGHTAAVALGVAAIFKTSAVAFGALKFVGAGYLLWLAWRAFRAGATRLDGGAETGLRGRELYLRGVVMNLTNPKVAVFFLAFLPQFADPAGGPLAPQIVQCGLLFMAATLLVFGTVAWTAGRLGERLRRSSRAQVVLNRVAGVVFLALAVRLALSAR